MPIDCSAKLFAFEKVERKVVLAGFDGGAITSNVGALLLGQVDRGLGLVRRPIDLTTHRLRRALQSPPARREAPEQPFRGRRDLVSSSPAVTVVGKGVAACVSSSQTNAAYWEGNCSS
jgi:hypothetical protein